MTFTKRWRGLTSTHGFVQAHTVLFLAWLVVSAVSVTTPVFQAHVLIIPLAFAAMWNAVSFRRIAATKLWPLHLAPYVTDAGGYALQWAVIESANTGPWVSGVKPWPWWEVPLQVAGIPALFAWPAATIALSLIKPRRTA